MPRLNWKRVALLAFFLTSTASAISAGVYLTFYTDYFLLKTIDIHGNKVITEEEILNLVGDLEGQNIFKINPNEQEKKIEKTLAYIKYVHIEKFLPSRIEITIEERKPSIIWINFTGEYLTDEEGKIIEIIKTYKPPPLSDEDIELLKGYGNLEELRKEEEERIQEEEEEGETEAENEEGQESSEEVSDTDEQQEEEIEIDMEAIREQMEEQRKEIVSQVSKFWQENVDVKDSRFGRFQPIYAYEFTEYCLNDDANLFKIQFSQHASRELTKDFLGEKVEIIIWASDYRFELHLEHGSQIWFGPQRDLAIQIEDLQRVLEKLHSEGKSFKRIDVRGTKVAVS